MIFHLVLNSFLVFLALACMTEMLLCICRIKQTRWVYICRTLPILKLPFDFVWFAVGGDNLFINLNPFGCEVYLQEFILSFFSESFKTELAPNNQMLIPQYVASLIPPFALKIFIPSIFVLMSLLLLRKLFQLIFYRMYLKRVIQFSNPCVRPINSSLLRQSIEDLKAILLVSKDASIPFAADRRYIILPENLMQELLQDEFEAVISHELEHLRWKDPLFKFLFSIVCALFWWIPTKWWIKRMEADQEQASDLSVCRYGIPPLALASALMKAVKEAKSHQRVEVAAFCPLDSAQGTHLKRFERLIRLDDRLNESDHKPLLVISACSIAFLSFWCC